MKILLTQAGEAKGIAPVFPLGLAYLAGSLSNGYEVKSFDLPAEMEYEQGLRQTVAGFCPDIVGISLRNLDNQRYYAPVSFLPEAKNVVRICRQSSKTKIVVGGSGFSIIPQPLLDYLGADLGVAGEGETAISSLVQAITRGSAYGNIPGIVTGNQEKRKAAKPHLINDLDSLQLPNRDIFEPKKYLQKGIALNIRAKRGCPFKCIYCTTPQIEGSKMRLRTPRKVVDELERLKKDYGAQEFYFTDNIFNYPAGHAESICEEIISRKLDIRWYCIANPCSLSRDVLKLMKKAGCYGLSIGNESGSPQILRNLRKNFTVQQVSQACLSCRELGINYTCFLLLGGPGENRKTVDESISLMERLKPSYLSINIGIRIYPNTELARLSRDEGIIDANNDLLLPTFYLSSEIKDWIFAYIKEVGERNGWTYPRTDIDGALRYKIVHNGGDNMPEHPLKIYEDLDQKLLDLVNDTRDLALADGVLPRKIKLLIAMVLDAVHGASDGVQSLAREAIKAGATREEIAEALRVAQYVCGVGCVYTAGRALKEVLK